MDRQPFSPREFMRDRHPEPFSDSTVEDVPVLDRSILEFHLDTLTNRGQENQFARFAKCLTEREICPNLLPQTGPTGGGDSKVDAETFPVADDLSMIWYVGIGRRPSSERWAFAFSAKKAWPGKVRSDIAKIASTKRGYSTAFFVSNQYIPDKKRSKFEDELRQKYNLDVRILDRSWILDRVFEGKHEELAIKGLGLAISVRRKVEKNLLGIEQEKELEVVDQRIEAAVQEGRFGFQLVNDSIESARLSRSLEHPRTSVEGRFIRAERIAGEYGSQHQRLVSAYEWAWTAFWWHEDYDLFAKLYDQVESHAMGTHNAYHLELLTNLWFLFHGAMIRGELKEAAVAFQEHTSNLTNQLKRLSEDLERPSTALQAQTLLGLLRLVLSTGDEADSVLSELQDAVSRCEGLVGFPLAALATILIELGSFLGDRPSYGTLFGKLVEVTSRRAGEVSAARMLVKRGVQQLDADRPYEAIQSLGLALTRLFKHESREDIVHALYLCAIGFERVGLLWAARGTMLSGASIAMDEFWAYEDITPLQATCLNHLKWLELQLGRFPHILAWQEVERVVRMIVVNKGYDTDLLSERELEFDVILGLLFLKIDLPQLERLSAFPDTLKGLGLNAAGEALLYALGHEEHLYGEFTEKKGGRDLYEFFAKWLDQPAAKEVPSAISLCEADRVTLSASLLGCRIAVTSEIVEPCVQLGESLLAALQSLLSTGILIGIIAREPVLSIEIQSDDSAEAPFGFEMRECEGRPCLAIQCNSFSPYSQPPEIQRQLKDKLFEVLATLIARVFLLGDTKQTLVKLFRDELALERAVNFTSSFVPFGNLLGRYPKTKLSMWFDASVHEYPLKRTEPWNAADRSVKTQAAAERPRVIPGKGEPPEEVRDLRRAKHTQIETVSLIREVLWEKAVWSGTVFLWGSDNAALPPVLALGFGNTEAGRQIFVEWNKELGLRDTEERLRISIILGISVSNPLAYRVVIGSSPAAGFSREDIKVAAFVSRLLKMEPLSDFNLKGFLHRYRSVGSYFLGYAGIRHGEPTLGENYIAKRELHVRNAWEIGRGDLDMVGIRVDDDPIILPGHEDAPVLELLRWRRRGSN